MEMETVTDTVNTEELKKNFTQPVLVGVAVAVIIAGVVFNWAGLSWFGVAALAGMGLTFAPSRILESASPWASIGIAGAIFALLAWLFTAPFAVMAGGVAGIAGWGFLSLNKPAEDASDEAATPATPAEVPSTEKPTES